MSFMSLCNARTSGVIASDLEFAVTRKARRRGLLGRDGLGASSALILSPCFAIHTAFMKFAIDVVFIDTEWRVLRTLSEVPAWRIAVARGASFVIELPAGSLRRSNVAVGDRLFLAALQSEVPAQVRIEHERAEWEHGGGQRPEYAAY